MSEVKDIEYYKQLQYDVRLIKKGEKFILFIPELSLIEEDENLEKAFEKVEKEKDDFFKKMIEDGAQEFIREPEAVKSKKTPFDNFVPFLIKLSIILVITVLAFISVPSIISKRIHPNSIASLLVSDSNQLFDILIDRINLPVLANSLSGHPNSMISLSGHPNSMISLLRMDSNQLVDKIIVGTKDKAYFLADRFDTWPEYKKEEFKRKLKAVVKNMKPFLKEIKIVLETDQETASEKTIRKQ